MIEVLHSGMFSSVQDQGRPGCRSYAVPVSGVLDRLSYVVACGLAGMDINSPAIETFMTGLTLKFHRNMTVGLAGAVSKVMVNDVPADHRVSMQIKEGDILRIVKVNRGWVSYVAINGEWKIEETLGSGSTLLSAGIGGFEGRALRKGDVIPILPDKMGSERDTPFTFIRPGTSSRIRIMEGPEFKYLTAKGKKNLVEGQFSISPQSDRTGLRLQGKDPEAKNYDIPSRPVFPGTIQLTRSGPILLLKDGQTTGGYPRIAQVISADLDTCGQLAPGSRIGFEKCSFEEASLALTSYNISFDTLKNRLFS